MELPSPKLTGTISVEQAIMERRTVRSFLQKSLDRDQLSQLLWATHGITEKHGFKRAAPSAGALYPMDLYVLAGKEGVDQIEAGVYHYEPEAHTVSLVRKGDMRNSVSRASLSQMWMAEAPVSIVITAEYDRITGKYGNRGVRYAMIEAGHMGQNLFLQAGAMGLRAGIVGAFRDRDLIEVLHIPSAYEPLLIMPVGYSD